MEFQDFWDKAFEKYSVDKEAYSQWLNDYVDIISNCKTEVLDLGCGEGSDSYYLSQKGLNVVACDFSKVALEKLKNNVKNSKTLLLDISKPLPFKNNSFDLVLADLSLHYFNEQTTKEIMKEIKRVLTPNGYLLARVNSINDINHGAGQGEKIENNFYYVKGYKKRFFNLEEVDKYFSIIGKVKARETEMSRYEKSKIIIEIKVKKT